MIELIDDDKLAGASRPATQDKPAGAVAPLPPAELVKLDLQTVALSHFGDWRGNVARVRDDLGRTALDLSIPARVAEAKTLRQRLIGTPRAEVRKVANVLKSRLAQVSRAVGAEADAAVAAYDDAEALITPQIEAAEERIEAERKAREEAEAKRLGELRGRVDSLLGAWVERCKADDMTAERAASGIAALKAIAMPDDLADVAGYWQERHRDTLGAMEQIRVDLAAAEVRAAQAKLDAERERVNSLQRLLAGIQAAATSHTAADAPADIAETLEAVRALDVSEAVFAEFAGTAGMARTSAVAALEALHAAAVARMQHEAEEAAEAERLRIAAENEITEGRCSQQVLKAEPATADATDRDDPADISPRGGAMGAGQPAAAGPAGEQEAQPGAPSPVAQGGVAGNPVQPEPASHCVGDPAAVDGRGPRVSEAPNDAPAASVAPAALPEPTLTLGALNEWLAPIQISGAGLELLGFVPAGRRKAAMLYHDTDKARIVAAMIAHLKDLA